MNISKYIYDYLMENNTSVIVPELGCFTIVNKPSEILDGVVIPPVQTVEFDSEKTEDDHILTNYIAQKENISIVQAAEEVKKFYQQNFISKLSLGKVVSFENFGDFSLDESANIVFKPGNDFFKANYGLENEYVSGFSERQSAKPPVSPKPENDFLDPNDSTRYRVKTDNRRQPEQKKQEQPVQPTPAARTAPAPKKQQKQKKTGNSGMWVLWVLIAAVIVGAAIYFINSSSFFVKRTTTQVIVNAEANQDTTNVSSAKTEESTSNPELAQTLDESTNKKNALNPAGSPKSSTSTPKSASPSTSTLKSASTPTSTSQTKSSPASVASSHGNVGSGKYVLIIGSFTIQSNAVKFANKLQSEGINCEIVPGRNQMSWVSIASYDSLAEAQRQANQMKSKPYCENIWIARR